MDEERRLEWGLFRYGCISELLRGPFRRGERRRILDRLAAVEWQPPAGQPRRLSVSTLKAWCRQFQTLGFSGLQPRTRKDRGQARVLSESVLARLAQLKQEVPARSLAQLIRLAEVDPALLLPPGSLKRATVHRHLAARGLSRQPPAPRRAYRRFERETPGELWQLDQAEGLKMPDRHHPGKWLGSVLFVAIDDHSRYCPHGQFYPDQTLPRLEHCVRQALGQAGVPQALYLDRAQIHVSTHFRAACASLGIRVILGRRREPAGRGKVERLIGVIQQEFYPEARALIARGDLTNLEDLNGLLWAWLQQDYHQRIHSETKESPHGRYWRQPPPPADPQALANLFLTRSERLVRKTATVSLEGHRYQVDAVLVGNRVELRYDPFDLTRVEVWVANRFHQLATPHTLATTGRPALPDRAPPQAQLTVSYLQLLKAKHDQHLRAEVERLRFHQPLPPAASTGLAPLLAQLETALGRALTPVERQDAQAFWADRGPLDPVRLAQALAQAVLHLGTQRHLLVYLETVKGRLQDHV